MFDWRGVEQLLKHPGGIEVGTRMNADAEKRPEHKTKGYMAPWTC